jgi:hypothetical protein
MAFGLVGQHFLRMQSNRECSGVNLLWHKSTVGLIYLGKKVDVCVDWAPGICHEHVVLGQALGDFVSGVKCKSHEVKAAWLDLLSQSREAGITQRRGGQRGNLLKTVVLSYIFGAALFFAKSSGGVFKEAVIQFVQELFSNELSVAVDAEHRLYFHLRRKPKRNNDLVVLNLCEHIGWHDNNCAQNALGHIGVSHLLNWLQYGAQMSDKLWEC